MIIHYTCTKFRQTYIYEISTVYLGGIYLFVYLESQTNKLKLQPEFV